jgi:hypothetical protein
MIGRTLLSATLHYVLLMYCFTCLCRLRRMNFFPVYSKLVPTVSDVREIYAVCSASYTLQGFHDNLESIV